MDELHELKSLLLKEEIENLSKLEVQLKQLDQESRSQNEIMDKISPILGGIIKKSYSKDKDLLTQALSPIVLELVDKNYQESQDKVVKQLAPLITTAIKEQIKSHKDEVVEALYPVIGNMITRYVSKTFEDMINAINNQIKSGLSFENITRKIKAKFHGVSESELLLKENLLSNIRSVFLIHKETGLVLNHAEHEDNPIKEPEMIASMMTAIRSFVNDWVDKNEKYQELGTIEYGGSKIVLEASGYSYLAVIVDGAVTKDTIDKVRETLTKLVNEFSDDFKNFAGNKETLENEKIYNILLELISEKKKTSTKKFHPLIFLIPFLVISWIIYVIFNNIIDNRLKKQADEILYKTPTLTLYRLNTSVENKELSIEGVVPFLSYKALAQEKLEKIKDLNIVKNNIQVIDVSDNPKEIKDKITYLIMLLGQKESIDIKTSYNYPNLKVSAKVWSHKELEYIKSQFNIIEGLKKVDFDIKIELPKIDEIIYFDKNSSDILVNQEYKLIKIVNLLNKLDKDLTLEIKAYRDFTGTLKRNEVLVKQRAINIENYLKLKGNISQEVEAIGVNDLPSNIQKEKYPEQGRRVTFSLRN